MMRLALVTSKPPIWAEFVARSEPNLLTDIRYPKFAAHRMRLGSQHGRISRRAASEWGFA